MDNFLGLIVNKSEAQFTVVKTIGQLQDERTRAVYTIFVIHDKGIINSLPIC